MYSFSGTHPGSGRQWRFFQSLNLTYVARSERRRFANDWMRIFTTTKNTKLTWDIVKRKYPYIKHAVRRYFYTPDYYITKLREIPFDQMEAAIVSTWSKDFSKKIKSSLFNKFRSIFRNREEFKKTGKFPSRTEKQQQKLQRKVYGERPSTQGSRADVGGQGVKGNIQQGPSRYDRWGWS